MGCYKIKNDESISGREYKYVQWALLILDRPFLAFRVISAQDGILGNGTMNKAPTLSRNISGYTNSKRLLQWALTIN